MSYQRDQSEAWLKQLAGQKSPFATVGSYKDIFNIYGKPDLDKVYEQGRKAVAQSGEQARRRAQFSNIGVASPGAGNFNIDVGSMEALSNLLSGRFGAESNVTMALNQLLQNALQSRSDFDFRKASTLAQSYEQQHQYEDSKPEWYDYAMSFLSPVLGGAAQGFAGNTKFLKSIGLM